MYALPASNPNSFAKLAGFHGGPPTAYCRHGAPGFFTWHRAYILAFEEALRTIRCNVTLRSGIGPRARRPGCRSRAAIRRM